MSTLWNPNRLVRSRDGWLGGVAGGLAQRFGLPPFLVRLVWLAAAMFFGTGVLLYLVMWAVLPHEDRMPIEPSIWLKGDDGRHKAPLARTAVDRKLLGVCGGLARYFDADPSVVRLAALGIVTLSAGSAIVVYLAAAAFMPSSEHGMRPIEL